MELEEVFNYYDVAIEKEMSNQPGEVLCFCPFHVGDSGEPRMQCNTINNIYHCWSCGAAGNYLDFIIAMESSVENYKEARMFYNGVIVGKSYDVQQLKDKLKKHQEPETQVNVEFVYKQQFNDVYVLMQARINELYAMFPNWYFVLRGAAKKITEKTNNPDVFFEWLDPNIENTIQVLDLRISRLEDKLLPSCQNNIKRLRSFYNYFLIEIQRLRELILLKIPYLVVE